jgi:hypothetical protein
MSNERLLLCRPQGGLNDMLVQIERCCRYGERFDRTVVVETDYRHAGSFRDSFAKYFVSRQRRLVLKVEDLDTYGDMTDVFPHVASERINDYRPRYDKKIFQFVDDDAGVPLSFDFNRDYDERTLLHHQSGGGAISVTALSRLRLHDAVTDLLLTRARILGTRYFGVHIRNTDYKTRYEANIATLAKDLRGPIFIATDNRNCLTHCQAAFGTDRVFSFAKLPAVPGRPLHHAGEVADVYAANRDAITDLLLLALSTGCYAFELEQNEYGVKYSGFSLLALNLQAAKPVLSQLIARSDRVLDAMLWQVEH